MQKIPTLFERDWGGDRRYVLPKVVTGCEWVIAGEGTPTRKYDGTCVMFDGERWWARREVKAGRAVPAGYVPLETDPETGKAVGWEPLEQSAFARWHAGAESALHERWGPGPLKWGTGTYELAGPKVNGNPEDLAVHELIKHEFADAVGDAPRDFEGLAAWLHAHPYEGIVWHHPDGRMAKIKRRDFRPPLSAGQP